MVIDRTKKDKEDTYTNFSKTHNNNAVPIFSYENIIYKDLIKVWIYHLQC